MKVSSSNSVRIRFEQGMESKNQVLIPFELKKIQYGRCFIEKCMKYIYDRHRSQQYEHSCRADRKNTPLELSFKVLLIICGLGDT